MRILLKDSAAAKEKPQGLQAEGQSRKGDYSMSDFRTRNWSFVGYPDSMPDDWLEDASQLCIPMFVSPLHDSDMNPDGEPKKPHYHFVLMFDSVKSQRQAQDVSDLFSGVLVQPVKSTRALSRYLCHLDNPEKVQYSTSDVLQFGGSDYLEVIESASDKFKAIAEMEDFCDSQGITSYAVLCRYARANRPDWHRFLCSCCSVHMSAYLKSAEWTNRNVQPDARGI